MTSETSTDRDPDVVRDAFLFIGLLATLSSIVVLLYFVGVAVLEQYGRIATCLYVLALGLCCIGIGLVADQR